MSHPALLEQAVLDLNEEQLASVPKAELPLAVAIATHLVNSPGDFVAALNVAESPVAKLSASVSAKESIEEVQVDLKEGIEEILLGNSGPDTHLAVLFSGVASLLVFVQANWTGPAIEETNPLLAKLAGKDIADFLSLDGETPAKKLEKLQYLILARAILVDNLSNIEHSKTKYWWSARVGMKHQEVLSGPSEQLRTFIQTQFQKAIFSSQASPDKYDLRLAMESGLYHNSYKDTLLARNFFFTAKKLSGLQSDLSGILGRRTKYQTFDTPQLVLLAKSNQTEGGATGAASAAEGPDSLEERISKMSTDLSDADLEAIEDIRLPHIKFAEGTPNRDSTLAADNLSVIDQCILLTLCLNVKNENPRHGLTWEEMMAYVNRVLRNPNNWMVHTAALLIKSRLESVHSRTVDKALMQLQVLVDQFTEKEKDSSPVVRMKYIFQLNFPTRCGLEKELAKGYLSFGIVRTAYDIFERLEMWHYAIECLKISKDDDKAMALVETRLKLEGETPELIALKGDLLTDVEERKKAYQRAWEVSKKRYALAKRQLGLLTMEQGNYIEAIGHYQEALAINPQYGSVWFRIGTCALRMSNHLLAQQSFARVTQLVPEDGEAWSNLASAFLRQKKYQEAYTAYREALKHSGDNWKIWDNFMVACLRVRKLGDAILAMHKLLDLNQKDIDAEILSFLVALAVEPENRSSTFTAQVQGLLDRINSIISNNAILWDIYAKYYSGIEKPLQAMEYRQRQVRALQPSGWESNTGQFKALVAAAEQLVASTLATKDKNACYSCKLSMRSILKKSQESFEFSAEYHTLKDLIAKLEAIENSQ